MFLVIRHINFRKRRQNIFVVCFLVVLIEQQNVYKQKATEVPRPLLVGAVAFPHGHESSLLLPLKNFVSQRVRNQRFLIIKQTVLELQNRIFCGSRYVEGLAGGAMLTMICATILPEAFEKGGAVVGLAALAGFLIAFCVKAL